MIIQVSADSYVSSAEPDRNFGSASRLLIEGPGLLIIDAKKYTYLYFGLPVPQGQGAVVTSATLTLNPAGAWPGDNHLSVRRVTESWAESLITFTNQPLVTDTNEATLVYNGDGDLLPIEIDVTDMIQDVADGQPWYGLRVRTSDNVRSIYAHQATDSRQGLGPTLEVEYSIPPNPPTGLHPDNDSAVADEFLIVTWQGGTRGSQTYAQVQTSDSTDFSSPDFDSGWVATGYPAYDLDADNGFGGVDDGETVYWRVRIKNSAGVASDWSKTAKFHRTAQGTLTLDAPVGIVHDLTPQIVWELADATQTRWEVEVLRNNESVWRAGGYTETQIEIPVGIVVGWVPPASPDPEPPSYVYGVRLKVWDAEARSDGSFLEETSEFTFDNNGGAFTIDNLVVQPIEQGSPGVKILWTADASDYDYFSLMVDGIYVAPRVTTADCEDDDPDRGSPPPGSTNFRLNYWHSVPRQPHEYEIQGVVTIDEQREHSLDNATVVYTPKPFGIWLVPTDIDTVLGVAFGTDLTNDGFNPVFIAGEEQGEISIGESASVYSPLDSPISVRVVENYRGYEGSVTGMILGELDRDQFIKLRAREIPVSLLIGDLVIPVQMANASVVPTPTPGDFEFIVTFSFFQVGPPWPGDLVGPLGG